VTRPSRANCAARRPVGVATEAEARYRVRSRSPLPKTKPRPATKAEARCRTRSPNPHPKPEPEPRYRKRTPNPATENEPRSPLPKTNTPGRRGRCCLTSPPLVASRRHQRPARTLHRSPQHPGPARSIRVCRLQNRQRTRTTPPRVPCTLSPSRATHRSHPAPRWWFRTKSLERIADVGGAVRDVPPHFDRQVLPGDLLGLDGRPRAAPAGGNDAPPHRRYEALRWAGQNTSPHFLAVLAHHRPPHARHFSLGSHPSSQPTSGPASTHRSVPG
jgi:hypothetical protein